jgi:hypothetical protein
LNRDPNQRDSPNLTTYIEKSSDRTEKEEDNPRKAHSFLWDGQETWKGKLLFISGR